ncbi:MAG: hypothetical protein IT168_16900 [Bryobacterales bacterium]|nr:hypothetical protein [Bryobacterales bacterium]
MRIDQFTWLDATVAFALFVLGCFLVIVEFVRPGLIVPGAVGGVLVLVTAVRLCTIGSASGAVLFAAAVVLLVLEIKFRWSPLPGLAPALVLGWAAIRWGPFAGQRVRWWVALPLSIALCSAAVILGSAAWRGFWAKRNW